MVGMKAPNVRNPYVKITELEDLNSTIEME